MFWWYNGTIYSPSSSDHEQCSPEKIGWPPPESVPLQTSSSWGRLVQTDALEAILLDCIMNVLAPFNGDLFSVLSDDCQFQREPLTYDTNASSSVIFDEMINEKKAEGRGRFDSFNFSHTRKMNYQKLYLHFTIIRNSCALWKYGTRGFCDFVDPRDQQEIDCRHGKRPHP